MNYGNSSNEWAFVLFSVGELMSCECCFNHLLYMDPPTRQPWSHCVSWNTVATIQKSQGENRKKEAVRETHTILGLIRNHSVREKDELKRAGRGLVVFPLYFLYRMKRTSGFSCGVGVFLATATSPRQELPYRVNISCPMSSSFCLQPQGGWVW